MRHSSELDASYLSSPLGKQFREHIDALREHLKHVPFSSYRGIGRNPLCEEGAVPPPWHEGDAEPIQPGALGRLMEELLGPYDYVTPFPRAFLSESVHAERAFEALTAPTEYEIVELCQAPDEPSHLLGFDAGYWGGGNFSILCDAAIWPVWHPPSPDWYVELAEVTDTLNRHALFPTVQAAYRYLDWYSRQSWAEKPPSDFAVVAVGAWKSEGRGP